MNTDSEYILELHTKREKSLVGCRRILAPVIVLEYNHVMAKAFHKREYLKRLAV